MGLRNLILSNDISSNNLEFDARAEDGKEFGEPGGMRGPGRRGDQVAVGHGFRHGQVDVRAASLADVGTNGGIGTALFPFEDSRGGEDLRGVADGCDGFVGLGVVVDDFDHAWDEADVFGGTTAGENQGVVVFGPDLVDRKSTRLNSSHTVISYAVFCLKKKGDHITLNQ